MNYQHQKTRGESRATPACDIQGQARHGFSLTEILLAVGTLAVGMLFIAGVFPVSIHFTTVAVERTIAATVADEAFAKIKLYGISDVNLSDVSQNLYENVALTRPPDGEFAYPSTPTSDIAAKKYWWSAICRISDPLDPRNVQVTVFVCRKAGAATTYRGPGVIRPVAVEVSYTAVLPTYELTIPIANRTWINDGYTIVDDDTGQIYRVLERYRDDPTTPAVDESRILRLDKLWQGGNLGSIWVVPSPVGGGRYPCIAVYQKVMRF